MNLAVLGNTPELSALELGVQWDGGQIARLNRSVDLNTLGGTVKLAELVDQPLDELRHTLCTLPTDHKIVFGFSVYAGDSSVTQRQVNSFAQALRHNGLRWKKQLKAAGQSARFVTSQEPALSSVIVTKEHLLRDRTDFIIALYRDHTSIARTTAVQDYKGFSQRDYGRPKRDHHSGMLPPKVARMMVNIACPDKHQSMLDPFCGSGTILQEALLLGHRQVIGSDISKKCITDTQANIAWAKLPQPKLYISDVLKLSAYLKPKSINVIVTEGYLGPLYPKNITQLQSELTSFYTEVFVQLRLLLAPAARLVVALPAWRKNGQAIQTLSLSLAHLGYSAFHTPVIYGRPDAKVLRQIIFLAYPQT